MTWPLTVGRSPRLLTGMQPCSVRLGGRPRRAERGELVVPERRDDSSARQILLPVVRVLADRPEGRPPVFRLGGGPGLSNLQFGCPPALAAHDVILVSYRGVGGSVRLRDSGIDVAAHRHHVVDTPPPLTALASAFRGACCHREELDNIGPFEGADAAP